MNLTLTDGPEVALVVTVARLAMAALVAAGPRRQAAGGRGLILCQKCLSRSQVRAGNCANMT